MSRSWNDPVWIQPVGRILVAREDALPGGTKTRFLPSLIASAKQVVYGGPFCGGAAIALSVVGKELGIPVHLFYAQRKDWHPRQRLAESYGAQLHPVPMGFLSHVQWKAQRYADEHGALHLRLGFDLPEADAALCETLRNVKQQWGGFDTIHVACGTGMLARCLATVWPEAEIVATCVGLKSRWSEQSFPENVRLVEWPTPLSVPSKAVVPFPCCPYYEAKAWETLEREQPSGRVLFWNVLGPADGSATNGRPVV